VLLLEGKLAVKLVVPAKTDGAAALVAWTEGPADLTSADSLVVRIASASP
jgi:hypothetical protein